jgi:hypothetical protein
METGAMTVCSQCSQVLGKNFHCTMCVKHYEQPTETGKRQPKQKNQFPGHVIELVARGTLAAERQEQGRHAAATAHAAATHAAATLPATAGIPHKRPAAGKAAAKSIPAQVAQRKRDKQGESDKASQVQEAGEAGEDLFSSHQDDSAQFGALQHDRCLSPISEREQDRALEDLLQVLPSFTEATVAATAAAAAEATVAATVAATAAAAAAPAAAATAAAATTAKGKSTTSAPNPRPLSKRFGTDGLALTWADLRAEVTKLNASLKPKEKHKALGTKSIQQFEDILDARDKSRALLSARDEHIAAAHRVTQGVQRTVNIRILTLLAKDSELMSLFKESMGRTNRLQVEAGSSVETHTGEGMGENHAFWVALQAAFNDGCNCSDFPFEYSPSERLERTDNHDAPSTVIYIPPEIKNGLLKGLGVITAKIPELFPPDFFDVVRLRSCYDAGVKEYQEMMRRWHKSGQHGGKPMWHFVSPVLTEDPTQQHLYLRHDSKRWDSLAFRCLIENVQELVTAINKPIPGGVGGIAPAAATTPSFTAGACSASWGVSTCRCMTLRLHR